MVTMTGALSCVSWLAVAGMRAVGWLGAVGWLSCPRVILSWITRVTVVAVTGGRLGLSSSPRIR